LWWSWQRCCGWAVVVQKSAGPFHSGRVRYSSGDAYRRSQPQSSIFSWICRASSTAVGVPARSTSAPRDPSASVNSLGWLSEYCTMLYVSPCAFLAGQGLVACWLLRRPCCAAAVLCSCCGAVGAAALLLLVGVWLSVMQGGGRAGCLAVAALLPRRPFCFASPSAGLFLAWSLDVVDCSSSGHGYYGACWQQQWLCRAVWQRTQQTLGEVWRSGGATFGGMAACQQQLEFVAACLDHCPVQHSCTVIFSSCSVCHTRHQLKYARWGPPGVSYLG
jgi:hypothetical protein